MRLSDSLNHVNHSSPCSDFFYTGPQASDCQVIILFIYLFILVSAGIPDNDWTQPSGCQINSWFEETPDANSTPYRTIDWLFTKILCRNKNNTCSDTVLCLYLLHFPFSFSCLSIFKLTSSSPSDVATSVYLSPCLPPLVQSHPSPPFISLTVPHFCVHLNGDLGTNVSTAYRSGLLFVSASFCSTTSDFHS